ncbi:class I SAM-dependent methyltransferase [Rhizobium leguminosarum]|uniref:class I SAM-dependent methyltransferase n=1 Tax=Rhizobium leguminosarum TaxID=384 RepID=UPI0021BC07E0|nr:class I SAM-dependent methyltransferase [Rhizobium leguminosarum]
MNSSTEILEMYEGYYADGSVSEKRAIAARQSVGHIRKITEGQTFNSVVDIGAGEGAVLSELSNSAFAKQFAAVEISKSGLDAISNRRIKNLASVDQFDGYKIPHPGKAFDLALAIHVLEHVEHERMFLYEARRVSRKLYIEVPFGADAEPRQVDPRIRPLWAYQLLHPRLFRKPAEDMRF